MSEAIDTLSAAPAEPARAESRATVAVWDLPLRIWHWALAAFVLLAWFTASGYDRTHRVAGYTVIALLLFRLAWGFYGSRYSRFRRLLPRLRATPSYLRGLRHGKTGRYLGLNPAGAAMLVALLLALAVSAITGALSVTTTFFGVWWIEDTHAVASDAVIILVIVHVVGTLLMSLLQRENLARAMLTGRKRRHVSGK